MTLTTQYIYCETGISASEGRCAFKRGHRELSRTTMVSGNNENSNHKTSLFESKSSSTASDEPQEKSYHRNNVNVTTIKAIRRSMNISFLLPVCILLTLTLCMLGFSHGLTLSSKAGQEDIPAAMNSQEDEEYMLEHQLSEIESQVLTANQTSPVKDGDTPPADPPISLSRFSRCPISLGLTNSSNFLWYLTSSGSRSSSGQLQTEQKLTTQSPAETTVPSRASRRRKYRKLIQPEVEDSQQQHQNSQTTTGIGYNKRHRSSSQQWHAPLGSLGAFNLFPLGKTFQPRTSGSFGSLPGSMSTSLPMRNKNPILSEFDVLVLTSVSVAMCIMSLVIISVWLFTRYKIDRKSSQRGSRTFLAPSGGFGAEQVAAQLQQGIMFPTSTKHSKRSGSSKRSDTLAKLKGSPKSSRLHAQLKTPCHSSVHDYLVPVPNLLASSGTGNGQARTILAPTNSSHNFLMRSPTIRRMHGLATNASDWFKFTLRAHPTGNGSHLVPNGRHRPLFMAGPQHSQLDVTRSHIGGARVGAKRRLAAPKLLRQPFLPLASTKGCPVHAFRCLRQLARTSGTSPTPLGAKWLDADQCIHCARLLAAIQRSTMTPFKGLGPSTFTNMTDSADVNSAQTSTSQSVKQTQHGSKDSLVGVQVTSTKEKARDDLETKNMDITSSSSSNNLQEKPQQKCYIPSAFVEALAKKLDEQQHLKLQQSTRVSSIYSNDQQARCLRTFGSNGNHSHLKTSGVGSGEQSRDRQEVQSELPTVDVDGRFKYHAESHLDLPVCGDQSRLPRLVSEVDNSAMGYSSLSVIPNACSSFARSSPTSSKIRDDDIFILIQTGDHMINIDSPQNGCNDIVRLEEGGDEGGKHTRDQKISNQYHHSDSVFEHQTPGSACQQASGNLTNHRNEKLNPNNRISASIMNDECSLTSSPVAYTFMRSSPSATTLSSAQDNYVVNKTVSSSIDALNMITSITGKPLKWNHECEMAARRTISKSEAAPTNAKATSDNRRAEGCITSSSKSVDAPNEDDDDELVIISKL